MTKSRDFHAEYLAANYSYSEILQFAKFFGGRVISKKRYDKAKNFLQNKKIRLFAPDGVNSL